MCTKNILWCGIFNKGTLQEIVLWTIQNSLKSFETARCVQINEWTGDMNSFVKKCSVSRHLKMSKSFNINPLK